MRYSALTLCLLAVPASLWADEFVVDSRVTAATVFPYGASLTRQADFTIPAGRHQLILTDMPMIDPAALRLSVPGATVGAIRYRDDFVPPRSDADKAALAAAKAEVETRARAVEVAQDAVASIRIEADAARARIAFLDGIGQSDGLAQATPDQLRELAALIGEEGLNARRAVQAAETRAREAERAVTEAKKALDRAEQALRALDTEATDRAYLVVEVNAAAPVTDVMTLGYTTEAASWAPTYDLRLTTGDAPALSMDRGAYVRQDTGENWTDLALTLSTVQPAGQTQPGDVWPWLRRIVDPKQMPAPVPMAQRTLKTEMGMADAVAAEPVVVEAAASFDGISVTYSYPDPVSVATGADAVQVALGSVDFKPEVFARAVPLSDRTAYLSAAITNNSGELILGSGDARFFLNGTFVGQRYLELIAEGDDAELSFGPIEGLRLERVVKDRMAGDRGVISKSNEQNEEVEITVRNLTGMDWAVRLRDRVPYSEQEDLAITWSADPMPAETDVDGKRGVMEWRFDMSPRSEQAITLSHRLRWPEGQVLQ